jgi:hypothetical protein
MSPPLSRWHVALRIGLFSALAGTLGVGCCNCGPQYVYPRNVQGFGLPTGCPSGAHPADTTQLNACLQGIDFDTTESMGDEQRLMVRESTPVGPRCRGDTLFACTYGPLAKIEPVKGSETYSDSALAEGRIIARMYLRPGETESYPKMGIVPGDTTYWWVSTSAESSAFVHRDSTQADLAVTPRGLERNMHPPGTFQQAFASWVWDENDERANGSCGSSCCKP